MNKTKMNAYMAFRQIKKVVLDERGNPMETLVTIPVMIHYNAGVPKNHRMLH